MDKIEMLDTIDSLIGCLRGDEKDIEDLIMSQLEWKDVSDLKEFYTEQMWDFYMSHESSFREDYYWEFVVKD